MRVAIALTILACLRLTEAHTAVAAFIFNGNARSDCIRPKNEAIYTYPLVSLNFFHGLHDKNLSCGYMPHASREAKATCSVAAGSKVGVGFANPPEPNTYPILIENHQGPILIYMAKHNHGSGGLPDNWFKIAQFGKESGKWAAPYTMWANQGKVDFLRQTVTYGAQFFTIPSDIPDGDYLIRAEAITLQEVSPQTDGGAAQVYIGCIQVTVTGGGNGQPTDFAQFPGSYDESTPGLNYVLWRDDKKPYPFPGPSVYVPGSTPVPPPPPTPPPPPPPVIPPTPVSPPTSPTGEVPVPPPFAEGSSTLKSDQILRQYQSLVDPLGAYLLVMQPDGNLCIYNKSYSAIWCTGSGDGKGKGEYSLVIQRDGNMVIYQTVPSWTSVWSTSTAGRGVGPFSLVLQSDRNLVLYDSNSQPTWNSGSGVNFKYDLAYNPFHNTTGGSQFTNASVFDPFNIEGSTVSSAVLAQLSILMVAVALLF